MPKKVKAIVKMEVMAGHASPIPPVGPILGGYDVNLLQFCREFNQRTQENTGKRVPVIVIIYEDKSFSFVVKMPKVSALLKEALCIARGSGRPDKIKVGRITREQLVAIAKIKMPDFNTRNLEAATRMVEGTAKSMGIETAGDASLPGTFRW